MFNYTVLLYHVIWPNDYLTYDVVTVFNPHDTGMLITWHWHVYTWHLILDSWYLIPVLDMLSLNTWYPIPDIWHLIIGMLSLDAWHMLSLDTDRLDLMLWHLTGYYYTWHMYCIAYSWLSLYRDLTWLLYCYQTSGTPELMYPWTPVSHVLMSPALLLLLIARSYWHPTGHAWCRDDEDDLTIMLASDGSWMELNATRSKVSRHTRGGGHLLSS